MLKRLIEKLRQAYPKALILFRADAGFAVPALYNYLEGQPETRYVIGFITNNRLLAETAPLWQRRNASIRELGRNNGSSPPSAIRRNPGSSPADHRQGGIYRLGANQRFVVTNLRRNPQFVYDDIYVLRGDAENRIKELKLEIKADRLSCHASWPISSGCCCTPRPIGCFGCCATTSRARNWLQPSQHLRLKLLKIGAVYGRPAAASGCTWPRVIHTATSWPSCCKTAAGLKKKKLRLSPQ